MVHCDSIFMNLLNCMFLCQFDLILVGEVHFILVGQCDSFFQEASKTDSREWVKYE